MPIAAPGRDVTIRISRKVSKMTLFVPMPLEMKYVDESVTRNVESYLKHEDWVPILVYYPKVCRPCNGIINLHPRRAHIVDRDRNAYQVVSLDPSFSTKGRRVESDSSTRWRRSARYRRRQQLTSTARHVIGISLALH